MRRFVLFALFITLAANAQDFRPERLAAHMRFLASDLLEGRGTGTRGHVIAAEYVATQYEAFGLEPGANGSYFQSVPFRKTSPIPGQSAVTIGSMSLVWGVGFANGGDPLREDARADGPVVYVGYGISAPSQHYDDYARVDVKGKIVAYFSGAPESFPNDLRAHYSASLVKLENAASHGAIGVLTLRTQLDEKRFAWERVTRQNKLGSMNWLERDGTPHATFPQIGATATLSRAGFR